MKKIFLMVLLLNCIFLQPNFIRAEEISDENLKEVILEEILVIFDSNPEFAELLLTSSFDNSAANPLFCVPTVNGQLIKLIITLTKEYGSRVLKIINTHWSVIISNRRYLIAHSCN